MEQASARHPTTADASPDGDVEEVLQSLSRAPTGLAEGGAVDVGIKGQWHARECPAQRAEEIEVPPARLRRRRDEAVGRGLFVEVHRTERRDTDRGQFPVAFLLLGEPGDHVGQEPFGVVAGRELLSGPQAGIGSDADRADELCAARFDGTDQGWIGSRILRFNGGVHGGKNGNESPGRVTRREYLHRWKQPTHPPTCANPDLGLGRRCPHRLGKGFGTATRTSPPRFMQGLYHDAPGRQCPHHPENGFATVLGVSPDPSAPCAESGCTRASTLWGVGNSLLSCSGPMHSGTPVGWRTRGRLGSGFSCRLGSSPADLEGERSGQRTGLRPSRSPDRCRSGSRYPWPQER